MPLLQQDLQELESFPTVRDEIFTENFTNLPAAWGAMYVMEGSTLGGQLILKHLKKKLGEDFNSVYFSAYGTHTGTYWKRFMEHLAEVASSNQWEDAIIQGAVKTFSLLDMWMQGNSLSNPGVQ